jgi:hypothetical protein
VAKKIKKLKKNWLYFSGKKNCKKNYFTFLLERLLPLKENYHEASSSHMVPYLHTTSQKFFTFLPTIFIGLKCTQSFVPTYLVILPTSLPTYIGDVNLNYS